MKPTWRLSAGGIASAITLALVGAASAGAQEIRPLQYTRYALPNGMVVIFNVDHASPLVAVHVAYHAGAKDDPPGQTGVMHLCEHAFSQGSPNLAEQQQVFYRSLGGTSTHWAETTEDVTTYYVLVPPNVLETVLWAEADRMASPFGQLPPERLTSIRGVVAQERQQSIENVTFGAWRELTLAALFPAGHPYHLEPVAAGTELSKTTLADLRERCGPYYVPNNAVVSLSGNFDPQRTKEWIAKYFAPIARGRAPTHRQVSPPAPAGERRLVLEDRRAAQPQLHVSWVGAPYASADRTPLVALASVLGMGRFGRLAKLLVDERQLATNVLANHYDLEGAGVFEIAVFPRPNVSLTTIETLVDSVVAGLAASPPTKAEIDRFNAFNATNAVTSLQVKLARADTLAHDEIFAGDPASYAAQANAARRLTPADLQRVAAKYLTSSRVVMSLVRAGDLASISKPNLSYVNVTPGRTTNP